MQLFANNAKCKDSGEKLNPCYSLVFKINGSSADVRMRITGFPVAWTSWVSPLAQNLILTAGEKRKALGSHATIRGLISQLTTNEATMYFEMTWKVSPPDPELSNTEKCDDTAVPWSMGVRHDAAVKQPINCWLNAKRGKTLRDAYLIDIPLFSDRLLDALRDVGIDNLQTFDAILHATDGSNHSNYKAINIIGAIKCADLDKSKYVRNPGAAFIEFSHLVIDASKARDLDFFRLGERRGRIMLSARAAGAIEKIKPVGIALLPIEST
jgi:hypothetical protein